MSFPVSSSTSRPQPTPTTVPISDPTPHSRDWQAFSANGQMVNILGFLGPCHTLASATVVKKQPQTMYKNGHAPLKLFTRKTFVYKNRHQTDEWISNMWSSHATDYQSGTNRNETTNICYNMDETQMHYVKWKKPATKVPHTV